MMKHFCQVLALSLGMAAGVAYGAGFSILEQTPAGLGKALGGISADTSTPNAQYFNPSILAWFDHNESSFGLHTLFLDAYYFDKGSHSDFGTNEGGNVGGWSVIPNYYSAHPITDRIVSGFGLSATSGTKTSHPNSWIGRYDAVLTDIAVLDLSPTLAYKWNDKISLGASVVIEHATTTMDKMLDFSALGAPDGKLKMKGDSIGVGFVLGVTYRPTEKTTVGLGYRSSMRHDLDMKVRTHGADAVAQALECSHARTSASTKLHLPASVTMGIMQNMNERWKMGLDVGYYFQSSMKDMRVKFDDAFLSFKAGEEQRTRMSWRNNWRISIGSEYQLTEKLVIRNGFCWDQTPTEGRYRNFQMPDADRFWFSNGIGYQFNEKWRLDAAFTYLKFASVSVKSKDANGRVVKGKMRKESCLTSSFGLTYSY